MSVFVEPLGALVVRAADAERLPFAGGSSITLLSDSRQTAGRMSVHRAALRSGAPGASPHHHDTAAELFYIVAGSAQLLVGDQLVLAHAGDLAIVPPGMPHAFAAAPGCDAEVLVAVTPGIERFDLFRRLASAGPAGVEDQSQFDTYADASALWRDALDRRTHDG
jgi:quercetin dioxygenase-like cupin family protein